jgi:hypothetical protein
LIVRARRFACALALSPALITAPAAAQSERPRIALVVDPCALAGTDHDVSTTAAIRETEKLLALELDARLEEPSDAVTTVRASCSASTPPLVALEVSDPITRKTVLRKIDLSTYPFRARARVLALAAAELVAASWAEAAANPTPKVEPAGPPPAPVERASAATRATTVLDMASLVPNDRTAAPTERTRDFVTAGFTLRSVIGQIGQIGGTLRLAGDLRTQRAIGVGASLDLTALQGRSEVSLGNVDATAVDVGGDVYAVARVAPSLSARGGVGLRVGNATLNGHARDPGTTEAGELSSVYVAPHATLALRALTSRALMMELGAEAGGLIGGPKGRVLGSDPAEQIAYEGLYLSPTIAAGAQF